MELAPNGAIKVDDNFKSPCDAAHALGDVINRVALTPAAITKAMVLTTDLFIGKSLSMDDDDIPTAVF